MYEIVHQAKYKHLEIGEVYKLVMDEMYVTGGLIPKFEYETRVDVVVLLVRAVLVCLVVCYA